MQAIYSSKHTLKISKDYHKTHYLNHLFNPFTLSKEWSEALISGLSLEITYYMSLG